MARMVRLPGEERSSIREMPPATQRENLSKLPGILQEHPEDLKYVDPDILKDHDELYFAAVSADQFAITQVPADVQIRHPEMPLSAIRRTPALLKYVPEKIMRDNPRVLETCAFNTGSCIEYIPAEIASMSDRIYDNAVRSDGMSLEFIPFEVQLKRPGLVAAAMSETPSCGTYANPKVFEISLDACLASVRADGMNLALIPASMQAKHPVIIDEAVAGTRNAVIYAESGYQERNLGLVRSVLRHHPDQIEELEWEFLSAHPDLIETAVKKDGMLVELFPEEYLENHPEITDAAIRQNGDAVYFLSGHLQDMSSHAIMHALSKNPYILPQIQPEAIAAHPEFSLQYTRSRARSLPEVAREMLHKMQEKDDLTDDEILLGLEIDPCRAAGILQEKKKDIRGILGRIRSSKTLELLPANEGIHFIIDRLESLLKEGFLPKAEVLDVLLHLPEEKFGCFDKKKWFRIAQNPIWERDPVTLRSLMLLSFASGMYEQDPRLSSKGQSFMESITRMRSIFSIDIPACGSLPEEIAEGIRNAMESGSLDVTQEPYRYRLIHCAQSRAAERVADNIWRDPDPKLSQTITYDAQTSAGSSKDKYRKLKKEVLEDIKKNHFPEYVFASETEAIPEGERTGTCAYARAILSAMYQKDDTRSLLCRVRPNLSRRQNTELCALLNAIEPELLTYNGITAKRLHQMADCVKPEYSSTLAAFLSGHREKLMEYGCDISYIQRAFSSASKRYMDDARRHMHKGRLIPPEKMTFRELVRYTTPGCYKSPQGIDPDVLFNASFVSNLYNYAQSDFERVCDIAQQAASRTASSIPQVEGEFGAYKYKVIPLGDISALQFGMKLSCCQQLDGAGESCMIHSMTSTNGRVLYLYDSDERAVYGSWIWRNGEVLCADNIEGRTRTIGGEQIIQEDVMECYRDWAKKEIAASQEAETNSRGILRVTFGSGYSDLQATGLEPDRENRFPLERVEYIHDSRQQYVLAQADDDMIRMKRALPDETPCIYEDNPEITPMFQPEVAEDYAYAGRSENRKEAALTDARECLHMTDLEDSACPGIPTVLTERQLYGFRRTLDLLEKTMTSRAQEKEAARRPKKMQKVR